MGFIKKDDDDGVEFYTDEATGKSGMSESGLARICGVTQQSMHELLKELVTGKARSDCLKPFAVKDLWLQGRGADNAKVVKDEVCAAVIEHYAFEARWKTEKALFAHRKFAAKGVRAWIQEITGWISNRKERIVRACVSEAHSPWRKRFEDEFFEEAYRVTGWRSPSTGHPPCMAQFINETIYGYFPEGTQDRLNAVNPRVNGKRKRKQHQHLTPTLGAPVLESQKTAVIAVMRLSPSNNRKQFQHNMHKALGTYIQIELPFFEDDQAS